MSDGMRVMTVFGIERDGRKLWTNGRQEYHWDNGVPDNTRHGMPALFDKRFRAERVLSLAGGEIVEVPVNVMAL